MTGFTIPAEILSMSNLTWNEKGVLAGIINAQTNGLKFDQTHFSATTGMKLRTVQAAFHVLRALGLTNELRAVKTAECAQITAECAVFEIVSSPPSSPLDGSPCIPSLIPPISPPTSGDKSPVVVEPKKRLRKYDYGSIPGFTDFWSFYPRSDGKSEAAAIWKALAPPAELLERIRLDILWRLSNDWGWKNNRIQHASTYLNKSMWEADEKRGQQPDFGQDDDSDTGFHYPDFDESQLRD